MPLKVLIADDEKKVCRLIQMLCNWEKLGMELVGTAYNGIEALEMIERYQPDILITDICMPGCDGIDVIEKVRESLPSLEILIISGYADFKYAQSAIRFGVSDYLLKPICQQELEETLQKLGERCQQAQARKNVNHRLMQYIVDDTTRRRCSFFFDLLLTGAKGSIPDRETLNRRYLYHFVPGMYRILILKLDYRENQYDEQTVRTILSGLEQIMRDRLTECCRELEFCQEDGTSYIVCNYLENNHSQFRQAVRSVVDDIAVKRFQLLETVYSLGMGQAVSDCSFLNESFAGAVRATHERLLEGCEKLLEPPEIKKENDYSDLISDFNYNCTRALELRDDQIALSCVADLKDRLLTQPQITGSEVFNAVNSVGIRAITTVQQKTYKEKIGTFNRVSRLCSSADMLFELLGRELCQLNKETREQDEEEERRPIRVAKQYILNHYMEPITLEQAAGMAGFSSSYFSSLFKKEMGVGFSDYLTRLRMEQAKKQLKNTKMNVKDICQAVGYNDLKHFTAIFRKYTGLKPGEFRKLYG